MNRAELIYLAPYLVSLLLLAGIFLFALQHRYIRGARMFAWLISGQILTTLGFIFELLSQNIETKLFWDTFQWLTSAFLVILPFLAFSIQLSEHKLRLPSLTWGLIFAFLGVFAALLLTDNIHHLFYQNPQLAANGPFPELQYGFTFLIYIYLLLYAYGASLYGIALLIGRAFQPRGGFRLQSFVIAVGFLIPLVLSFLPLVNIKITYLEDITPLTTALGSLIAAWGLFQYGLFDIVPAAHEQIIESLVDPIVVVDARNRIVDINNAALTLIGRQKSGVLGQRLNIAFAQWPTLLEVLNNPLVQKKEILSIRDGKPLVLDISVSPILGRKKEMIGRILVAHDMTRLKTLENNYQAISQELEERIKNHTEEMQIIAQRYRTIVDNHTDFIVRWKPDGTRTFVNEAYYRYWGISYEEALAMNFLFHSAEENRTNVEEIIARLNSGSADVETETYQIIRPDGSLAWQEWTDKAIRDEWGKLIEIQSVGRDITERKRAEENLNY